MREEALRIAQFIDAIPEPTQEREISTYQIPNPKAEWESIKIQDFKETILILKRLAKLFLETYPGARRSVLSDLKRDAAEAKAIVQRNVIDVTKDVTRNAGILLSGLGLLGNKSKSTQEEPQNYVQPAAAVVSSAVSITDYDNPAFYPEAFIILVWQILRGMDHKEGGAEYQLFSLLTTAIKQRAKNLIGGGDDSAGLDIEVLAKYSEKPLIERPDSTIFFDITDEDEKGLKSNIIKLFSNNEVLGNTTAKLLMNVKKEMQSRGISTQNILVFGWILERALDGLFSTASLRRKKSARNPESSAPTISSLEQEALNREQRRKDSEAEKQRLEEEIEQFVAQNTLQKMQEEREIAEKKAEEARALEVARIAEEKAAHEAELAKQKSPSFVLSRKIDQACEIIEKLNTDKEINKNISYMIGQLKSQQELYAATVQDIVDYYNANKELIDNYIGDYPEAIVYIQKLQPVPALPEITLDIQRSIDLDKQQLLAFKAKEAELEQNAEEINRLSGKFQDIQIVRQRIAEGLQQQLATEKVKLNQHLISVSSIFEKIKLQEEANLKKYDEDIEKIKLNDSAREQEIAEKNNRCEELKKAVEVAGLAWIDKSILFDADLFAIQSSLINRFNQRYTEPFNFEDFSLICDNEPKRSVRTGYKKDWHVLDLNDQRNIAVKNNAMNDLADALAKRWWDGIPVLRSILNWGYCASEDFEARKIKSRHTIALFDKLENKQQIDVNSIKGYEWLMMEEQRNCYQVQLSEYKEQEAPYLELKAKRKAEISSIQGAIAKLEKIPTSGQAQAAAPAKDRPITTYKEKTKFDLEKATAKQKECNSKVQIIMPALKAIKKIVELTQSVSSSITDVLYHYRSLPKMSVTVADDNAVKDLLSTSRRAANV